MIHLSYTQYERQFVCKIEDIVSLSVSELKQLEHFASARSGKLDYNSQSLIIPKRIELQHLQELLALSGIEAFVVEHEPRRAKISSDATINFGKFKGQKWTELSEDYLLWLTQNIQSEDRQTALAELERRKKKQLPKKRTDVIGFGKHKGELWEELPTPYLQWVAHNVNGEAQQIAAEVLARRA